MRHLSPNHRVWNAADRPRFSVMDDIDEFPPSIQPHCIEIIHGQQFYLPGKLLKGDTAWLIKPEEPFEPFVNGPDRPMVPGPYMLSMCFNLGTRCYCRPYAVISHSTETLLGMIDAFHIAVGVRDMLNYAGGYSETNAVIDPTGALSQPELSPYEASQLALADAQSIEHVTHPNGRKKRRAAAPDCVQLDAASGHVYERGADRLDRRQHGTTLTFQGDTLTIADWAAELEIPVKTIRSRIARGWPVEDILKLRSLA